MSRFCIIHKWKEVKFFSTKCSYKIYYKCEKCGKEKVKSENMFD